MKKFNKEEFINGSIARNVCTYGFDDIEFVGLLCSATIDIDTGEKYFFTVDKFGKATGVFENQDMTPAFSICMKDDDNTTNINKAQTNEKLADGSARFLEVIRFYRLWDTGNTQISNYGGMTVICVIDYLTRKINVYPAFCMQEDNFSRVDGLKIAKLNKENNKGFIVDLKHGVSLRETIVRAFFDSHIKWNNKESEKSFTNPLERFITV